jgi:hypothetical protein
LLDVLTDRLADDRELASRDAGEKSSNGISSHGSTSR